jgi:hypothetical protein
MEILGAGAVIFALFESVRANTLARKSLESSQRSWIGVQSVSTTNASVMQNALVFTMENYSDFPATQVQTMVRIGGRPKEELNPIPGASLDAIMPHQTRDSVVYYDASGGLDVMSERREISITILWNDVFGIRHRYIAIARTDKTNLGQMAVVNCTVE